ncbi:MAG: alginate lyase family protein [Gemmatimonadaceae bacterium]|nr:alginate lyase family protein [Gemmatimonadaceae bacterium]
MNSGRRTTLARLRGRSLAELRFRGLQATAAFLERVGVGDLRDPGAEGVARHLASRRTLDAWCADFRRRGGSGFFAGFDDPGRTVAAALRDDADGSARVVHVATRATEGTFDLLGYHDLSFGTPVDWHLDPVAGVRAPRAHWSRVAYLDPRVVGDHKVTWELNRHAWLVSLAQAWRITGETRYATAANAYLAAWMDDNPPKVGINWASSLEVAFRAIAWCWVLRFLGDAPALADATVCRAVGHLRLSARHLERNLSTWFSPNTHLTGEALALYYLGHELRDLTGAEQWRSTGRRVLLEWLPTHVRPDGTYFEQSTWYHRYTLDFYVHFLLLAQRTGDALPPQVADSIGRLGEVLRHIARLDGSIPLIGDDDGGRILSLDGRTQHDARPAIAAAALASRRSSLAASGTVTSETLWLFGEDATQRGSSLVAGEAEAPRSRLFADGGLAVLRDANDAMVLDAGVHGAMNCGHAHADALAFDLTWRGAPLFVDPGTMAYTADPATRNHYRATASHNAATVDGRDSSEMTGPFSWGQRAEARVEAWRFGPGGDCLVASHDGYDDLATQPFACQRTVVRLGNPTHAWIVRDRFIAQGAVSLTAHLQCAPGTTASPWHGALRLQRNGTPVADLYSFPSPTTASEGKVSTVYGVAQSALHLATTREQAGLISVVTVLVGDGAAPPVYTEDEGGCSIVLPGATAEGVVLCGNTRSGDLSVDGLVLYGERTPGGLWVWWQAVGARRVVMGGVTMLDSREATDTAWTDGGAPLNSN